MKRLKFNQSQPPDTQNQSIYHRSNNQLLYTTTVPLQKSTYSHMQGKNAYTEILRQETRKNYRFTKIYNITK